MTFLYELNIVLGEVRVVSGRAVLTTTALQPGTREVHAFFNGDATYEFSLSRSVTVTVTTPAPQPTFIQASGSPVAVGLHPVSAAVGDFNGDGKADVAIANSDSNDVTVLLGNGQGGFTSATGSPWSAGSGPASVVVADFNEDGKVDLAIANFYDSSVTVLLGNGNGGFVPARGSPFGAGSYPHSLAVGDFNGDGKPDLAIANALISANGTVTVLLGNGSGGFAPASASPFTVGTYPLEVVVGDFNRDGKGDLAVANYYSDNVTLLFGNGSGGFTEASGSPVAAGGSPYAIARGISMGMESSTWPLRIK